ncbi:MAG TPA: hypothetical protein VIW24_25505 [Aldersonia sp.]
MLRESTRRRQAEHVVAHGGCRDAFVSPAARRRCHRADDEVAPHRYCHRPRRHPGLDVQNNNVG